MFRFIELLGSFFNQVLVLGDLIAMCGLLSQLIVDVVRRYNIKRKSAPLSHELWGHFATFLGQSDSTFLIGENC